MHGPVVIVGLGSIGRRHLRNLQRLGCHEVLLCRTGCSTLPDEELAGLEVISSLDAALTRAPAAVVVANPTSLHVETTARALRSGCAVLVEKPLSHDLRGVAELVELERRTRATALVGFQFRFHPGLERIRRWLDEGRLGRIVSAHVHWGEYLPGWHPWEDYRHSYSARADLGGGVVATLCHPLDYLAWLLGPVRSVQARTAQLGDLGIDVEDTALVLLEHACGAVASVYLDYVQRPPVHDLRLVGREAWVSWNQSSGEARLHAADGSVETYSPAPSFERNDLFLREMAHFLACVRGEEAPRCTLEEGARTVEIISAIRRAETERRSINV